eukprot:758760-Hanusia_phi.AAC.6
MKPLADRTAGLTPCPKGPVSPTPLSRGERSRRSVIRAAKPVFASMASLRSWQQAVSGSLPAPTLSLSCSRSFSSSPAHQPPAAI